MNNQPDTNAPLLYRLALALGRPFGVRWVGDLELAAIFRMEQYYAIKGPGFFWINPLTQRVESHISIAPDFISTAMSGIQTKDGLQLEFSIALAYRFDPRTVAQDKLPMVIKWTVDTRRAIVTDRAQRTFQSVVPQYYAQEICRGEVFDSLETKFMTKLTDSLEGLALKPVLVMVKEVKVPPVLQDRFVAVAQRAINAQDIVQYEPYVLTQTMRTEAIEAMQSMLGGKVRLDMGGLVESALPSQSESQWQPRQIVPPAASGKPKSRLRPPDAP